VNFSKEFVRLDTSLHDRADFDCGEPELNEFIRKHAVRHMEAGVSTTMVLPGVSTLPNGKYPIFSFYTIAPGSIARATLPDALRKKLPYYPVPVFLIAEMAVRSDCQGQGLGKITLIKALDFILNIHRYIRAYAVIVDCLNENVVKFYKKYGFQVLDSGSGRTRMFLSLKTVEKLFKEG